MRSSSQCGKQLDYMVPPQAMLAARTSSMEIAGFQVWHQVKWQQRCCACAHAQLCFPSLWCHRVRPLSAQYTPQLSTGAQTPLGADFPDNTTAPVCPRPAETLCSICCCSGVVLCTALMALLCQARELNLATKWASTSLSLTVSILRLLGLDFPAAFNDTILVACPLQLCPHSAYPN